MLGRMHAPRLEPFSVLNGDMAAGAEPVRNPRPRLRGGTGCVSAGPLSDAGAPVSKPGADFGLLLLVTVRCEDRYRPRAR
jgi:hypothetical protein